MRKFFSFALIVLITFVTKPSLAQDESGFAGHWRFEVGTAPGLLVPNSSTPDLRLRLGGDTGFGAIIVAPINNRFDVAARFVFQKASVVSAGVPLGKIRSKDVSITGRVHIDNYLGQLYFGAGVNHTDVEGKLANGISVGGDNFKPVFEVGILASVPKGYVINGIGLNFSQGLSPNADVTLSPPGIKISRVKYNSRSVMLTFSVGL